MRRFLSSLVALTLLSGAATLRAQDATQLSELRPGIKVRVEAPGAIAGVLTATVLARSRDSITLGAPNISPLTVPVSRITQVDVSRGKSRGAGAIVGMKWGVPIGLLFGLIAAPMADCTSCVRPPTDAQRAAIIPLMGIGGAMYGAGIGALIGHETWARFQLTPHASSDAGATRGGLALRASF